MRGAFVPAGKGYEWRGPLEKNFIDKAIFGKLRRLRLNSSVVCDDTVFLRRATLDLAGRLPTSDEARAFISAEKSGNANELLAAEQKAKEARRGRWHDWDPSPAVEDGDEPHLRT